MGVNDHGDGDGDGYGHGSGSGYGDGYMDVPHDTPIIAWHYADRSGHLAYDLRDVKVHAGLVLECDPEIVSLCSGGLHASMTPEEASRYRTGVLCRVAVSGRVQWGGDKLTGSRREVIEICGQGDKR